MTQPLAEHPSAVLCAFLSRLQFADLPVAVVRRAEELFLDWVASALASRDAHPIPLFERYAARMGPASGPCTILVSRKTTSPYFAAMINGASSHLVEQDDLHNSSVLHPATVVFPAVFAAAQDLGKSGADLLVAAVAGYEAGIRIGEFLGRSHYKIFHTTATVGTLAAAVGVGRLLGLDPTQMGHALGSAGTQAAGLWEFLRDAADSKQLHTAKAASDGLLSAYMAADGLTGARRILDGEKGMAAGMSSDSDPSWLVDGLGTRWATLETSFKFHASCRHTHPAADALDALMRTEGLRHDQVASVTARVHQAALDVLGGVTDPRTVHQAKFSMGTVLGLIAVHGNAGIDDVHTHALNDPAVIALRDKVRMVFDPEVEAAYPKKWLGRVALRTTDGREFSSAVDAPKGDPDNTLSRPELEAKLRRLVRFSGAASDEEASTLIHRLWAMHSAPVLPELFDEARP